MMIFLFSTILFATEKHVHQHAHQHGHAKIDIAFDGSKGKIEIETPADTIFGFEYAPKTKEQKKLVTDKTTEVENSISKMLVFDASLLCKIQKEKTEQVQEGKNHSEMHFSFLVTCAKSPMNSTLTFFIQSVLPKAKDVDVQIIVDSLQKSFEVNQNASKLELK